MSSIADYIRAESVETDHAVVMKDGSLMSMVRLHGMLNSPGEHEIIDMATRMRVALAPFFSNVGHVMSVTFTRDPVTSRRSMERLIERTSNIARTLGLDMSDVLDERLKILSGTMIEESVIVCLYSRTSLLTSEERKGDIETRSERTKNTPFQRRGQTPNRTLDGVLAKHGAFVDMVTLKLRETGQMVEIMNSRDLVEEMRFQISPSSRSGVGGWEPLMPWEIRNEGEDRGLTEKVWSSLHRLPSWGNEINATRGADTSWIGVPSIDRQISLDEGERLDTRRIRIGDLAFESFDMSVPSQTLTSFNSLVASMYKQLPGAPWRATFYYESGGVQAMRMKRMFLTFFKMMNSGNARVQEAIDRNAHIDGRHDTIIKFRATFSTWGPSEDVPKLRRQSQAFQGAVRQWGVTQIDGISGDPFATTIASMAGMTTQSTAPAGAGPMTDILAMSPFGRQASPWQEGSVIFRTETGKPWYFEPGSKNQDVWINIIMGAPGKGKSVLMNTLNLGMILSSSSILGGGAYLPMVAIIDVGFSSTGLISLVREALPYDKKHLAVSRRLSNDPSDAINVFDTHLGMYAPVTIDRQFLINLLSIICGSSTEFDKEMVPKVVSILVDEAYLMFSPNRKPKPYAARMEYQVDNMLDELNYKASQTTKWWDVVHFLISEGRYHEATLAQRHAVPNLSELAGVLKQSGQIKDTYGTITHTETKENLIDSMVRKIGETTREFPILKGVTRIDLGMARIISLDLQDVTTGSDTPIARRQTAIMYMVARQICSREFFLNPKEFTRGRDKGYLYEPILEYHLERAEANRRIRKTICYDEYHRTKGIDEIRSQVITDGREGRKFGVVINVASQHATDFSTELIDFCSGVFVCNADGSSLSHLKRSIDMTPTDEQNIMTNLTGPSRNGAPFWVMFRVKGLSNTKQSLSLKLGPNELWAFSTDAYDAAVRDLLYEKIGPKEARRILSKRFASGSVADEIRRRIKTAQDAGERGGEALRKNIIGDIVDDLMRLSIHQE